MHSTLSNTQTQPVSLWTTKDGQVPFFDDPTFNIEMLKWNREPDTAFDSVYRRVLRGEISKIDIDIAIVLARAKVLTEKQLRHLFRNIFPQSHKLATRLRFLQKIGWFEGWRLESQFNDREHLWSIGIAAKNYLGYGLGMEVPDPIRISQSIKNCLPFCAINDIRIMLVEKGVLKPDEFYWYPELAPDYESPMALMAMQTPIGKMVMYVERLSQNKLPARFMARKIKQYLKTFSENGGLYNPIPNSLPPVIVWSCGSEEAMRNILSVQKQFPSDITQFFLVDEFIKENDLRYAWRVATMNASGEATIRAFDMDFL
ncbi:hypothetical protein [Paenibacillus sp. IITD108]|uniref:hypothetical protein n=1 Tax=Paenibacillus sp. IITD108 TaxID=3116649 RepID=UPI002F4213A4